MFFATSCKVLAAYTYAQILQLLHVEAVARCHPSTLAVDVGTANGEQNKQRNDCVESATSRKVVSQQHNFRGVAFTVLVATRCEVISRSDHLMYDEPKDKLSPLSDPLPTTETNPNPHASPNSCQSGAAILDVHRAETPTETIDDKVRRAVGITDELHDNMKQNADDTAVPVIVLPVQEGRKRPREVQDNQDLNSEDGVDKSVTEVVGEMVQSGWDMAREDAAWAGEKVKEGVEWAGEKIKGAFVADKDDVAGDEGNLNSDTNTAQVAEALTVEPVVGEEVLNPRLCSTAPAQEPSPRQLNVQATCVSSARLKFSTVPVSCSTVLQISFKSANGKRL
jgi:hypothetical protein